MKKIFCFYVLLVGLIDIGAGWFYFKGYQGFIFVLLGVGILFGGIIMLKEIIEDKQND